jgi:lysozyme family protein
MTASNFSACLKFTLQYEGGWSNHKQDPGGATMKGVTQRVYDAYRRRAGKQAQSVFYISDSELNDIYRLQYWNTVRGDELPVGVDLAVFDHAVNSGPVAAIKMLQRALKVTCDGNLGLATIAAAKQADPKKLVAALVDAREGFLKTLKIFPVFGRGWMRRTSAVRAAALTMIGV